MRERVKLLGGEFEILSRKGGPRSSRQRSAAGVERCPLRLHRVGRRAQRGRAVDLASRFA
jgi:hypothetical protein